MGKRSIQKLTDTNNFQIKGILFKWKEKTKTANFFIMQIEKTEEKTIHVQNMCNIAENLSSKSIFWFELEFWCHMRWWWCWWRWRWRWCWQFNPWIAIAITWKTIKNNFQRKILVASGVSRKIVCHTIIIIDYSLCYSRKNVSFLLEIVWHIWSYFAIKAADSKHFELYVVFSGPEEIKPPKRQKDKKKYSPKIPHRRQ